jgi:hypothetical protein
MFNPAIIPQKLKNNTVRHYGNDWSGILGMTDRKKAEDSLLGRFIVRNPIFR